METHTFASILKVPNAAELDRIIAAKGQSPKLRALGDPERALEFMRANLCGSYVFAKFAVPAYAAAIFGSLSDASMGPPDDHVGRILKGIMGAVEGELFNNNIFGREGECHSHFWDALEAYRAANGDAHEFDRFLEAERAHGFEDAMSMIPQLWTEGSLRYARNLRICVDTPLPLYILFAANEAMTPDVYGAALEHLPREERFDKERQFLASHVALDQDDHGPIAFEWLALAIEKQGYGSPMIRDFLTDATRKVIALYGAPFIDPAPRP